MDKEEQYFEKFLAQISDAVTKENVRKAFLELRSSANEQDEVLFNKILMFLEKKIDEEGSLHIDKKGTRTISLKIKIFKKNPNTERYKLIYGYLTTIAAETLGNFYLQTDKPMDYIGIELEKGNLTAKKGGNFVGFNMSGGSIHILKDTGIFTGQKMSGGSIKIYGTAGLCLGDGIRGGEIYAKMADKTANESKYVRVEKYIENSPLKIEESPNKSLLNNYDVERYAKEALENIVEHEKRDVIAEDENIGLKNIDVSKEVSEEVSKEINSLKFEKAKQETGLIHNFNEKSNEPDRLLSNIMEEVYGKVDIKRIEEVDYVPADKRKNQSENFTQLFITKQKDEEYTYKDENFERLKLLFKYKEPNKDEILAMKLDVEDIKKILDNVAPFTISEKMIIGYLTSIAAEKLAIRGEALIVKENFDYIGIEMRNGRILVKNAGSYLGKNMYDGEIKVEGDALGNVGEGMVGGKIEIAGDVYGDYVGWRMEGGEILIKGSCRNFVGLRMLGGRIIVEKSAGNGVGERMEGGEILIKGRCGVVGEGMKSGVIRIREGIISENREGGEIYKL